MRRKAGLLPKTGPLCHTKTVLSINNNKSQVFELNYLFYQCMSTYDDAKVSLGKALQNMFSFPCRGRTGEQMQTNRDIFQQFTDSIEMLLSQDFSWGH